MSSIGPRSSSSSKELLRGQKRGIAVALRKAKKAGLVPWGSSYQWADSSLQFHTFVTLLGLTLAALTKLALGSKQSALAFMRERAGIKATLVRTNIGRKGRRPADGDAAPEVSSAQKKAVKIFI